MKEMQTLFRFYAFSDPDESIRLPTLGMTCAGEMGVKLVRILCLLVCAVHCDMKQMQDGPLEVAFPTSVSNIASHSRELSQSIMFPRGEGKKGGCISHGLKV